MNNIKPSGPRDEVSTLGGDMSFVGVDERNPAHELAPGFMAGARNKRFREGKAADRPGVGILPWCKGDGRTPFADVYGAALFAVPDDPNAATGTINEWVLIAADGGIWRTRANTTAVAVPLPAGVTISRETFAQFVQGNASIILLRGLNQAPLECTDFTVGFVPIPQQNQWETQFVAQTNQVRFPQHGLIPGEAVTFDAPPLPAFPRPDYTYALPGAVTAGVTYYVLEVVSPDLITISATPGGTQVTWNNPALKPDPAIYDATITVLDGAVPIPNASYGIFAQNRLFLVNGKDTVLVSDIGDFTRYQPASSVFRINEGDSYTLLGLYLYNANELIFFEDGVVRKATGVSGDLSAAQGPLDVTKAYGIAAPRGIADAGTDLYWLNSELRVVNLALTQLNQTQATDAALSDPLPKSFGRINSTYKDRARLVVHDSYLYCALPLYDAELLDTTDLVPDGTYSLATPITVTGLTAGATYKWSQNVNGGQLVNGTETLYGDCEFTAQGTSAQIYGWAQADAAVTDTLYRVKASGVNTAVAVYDFIQNAWAGTDQGPGVICIVDWLKVTLNGRKRLVFMGADGFLHLYGDSYDYPYEDEILGAVADYTDVLINSAQPPQAGDSLYVTSGTGGTLFTAADSPTNAENTWGISNGNAGANLWQDSNGTGGYNPAAAAGWTLGTNAGTVTVEPIADGVRFVGTVQVKINGPPASNGVNRWAIVDIHTGQEIQPAPITSWIRTRGYPCSRLMTAASYQSLSWISDANSSRFTKAALQLQSWAPNYTIRTYTQGAGDTTLYRENETRDRTQYFTPFDAAAFDVTNVNNDYAAPSREDYSTRESGPGLYLQDGVPLDAPQEYVHRVPVNEFGLWMQLDITNQSGHLELLAVAMEAQQGEVLTGPQVK